MTFVYNESKISSEIGLFVLPQSTLSLDTASSTMNLSLGERPVYLPVRAVIAPSAESLASPLAAAFSVNSATDAWIVTLLPLRRLFKLSSIFADIIFTYRPLRSRFIYLDKNIL